jgi:diaminohydroxyphosphoribosylaminopyrimidine deaminase/5-amino-6-(5-phosphoribosylamino)uracil reductase
VIALSIAGRRAQGATLYVTLEPCCHFGKTPPCTRAILDAGIAEVVVAQQDPFPQVSGGGVAELRAQGIDVHLGVMQAEAERLNAPYLKLVKHARPWVIAKWAMTLDGHTATTSGASRWISNDESRAVVHQLRGRVDAIIVGRGTATTDDPLLTARPVGARVATRVVLDSQAALSLESQLVRTASDAPVLIAAASAAPAANVARLRDAGCEVFLCAGETTYERLDALLAELGRRRMTNVLVEGGATLLGSLFDAGAVDEVHAFIAPQVFGGQGAPSAVGGIGVLEPPAAWSLEEPAIELLSGDVYVHGHVRKRSH